MKNILEIELDKSNTYEWDVVIKNDSNVTTKPIVKFVVEASNLTYTVEAKNISGTTYSVDIPPMSRQLGEGKVNCKLEVIVGDRYFVPWEQEGMTINSLKVEAKKKDNSTKVRAKKLNENKAKKRSSKKGQSIKFLVKTNKGEPVEIV